MQAYKYFSLEADSAVKNYRDLILPRRIEEKMLRLLRQNRISKWFSGMGQEAIPVGVATALQADDVIMTMHRNLGVFTTRRVPLYHLFCQLLGKKDGFTNGRDRSFHFGIPDYHICGMISHLAAMLPVADGFALAAKLKQENRVALAFCGEGSTSEGDFHEALNLAAVWDLPVLFMIENNGYALSTPTREQYRCAKISDKAAGYGMKSRVIDGNSLPDVIEAVAEARAFAIAEQKPVLLEAMTFRMRGHEEASGTAYVPKELFETWAEKDPILQFENLLKEKGLLDEADFERLKAEADAFFLDDLYRALEAPEPVFDEETETSAVFSLSGPVLPSNGKADDQKRELRFVDAVKESLDYVLTNDDSTLIMGQDIAEYGGAFKVTQGFLEKFGHARIRNTPIIESGIVGAAIGLTLSGFKPIVEMQFSDFITCAFNQIVNNVGKSHYRWTPPLNITIRMPHGAGVSAGPFHSQSPEPWFMQHPGLKIVVPSSVEDAYNLLYSAIMDPNPVLFFEHKMLYRSLKGEIGMAPQYEPLGKARVVREGRDFTIVTYGMGVHWALDRAAKLSSEEGIEAEIVDLRSLVPLDTETVRQSVAKTNRVLLLEEATAVLGPMAEVAAQLSEHCFELLDAPLMRCSSLNTPVPLNRNLEQGYLPTKRLDAKIRQLLDY